MAISCKQLGTYHLIEPKNKSELCRKGAVGQFGTIKARPSKKPPPRICGEPKCTYNMAKVGRSTLSRDGEIFRILARR